VKRLLKNRHFRGLMIGSALLLAVHIAGTLGYHYLGRPNASWIDSFYMTFITVSTIGYGEVVDLTHHPMGRLFTVGVAVVGIGTLSYLFSATVALLVDSDMNAARRKKRMEKDIAQLSGHYIICGVGRVGANVARELAKTERRLVVIENDRAVLDAWLEHHPGALHLHDDAASDDALTRAGVAHAAGVFAVTGDDSHNLMVSLSVKLLNPKCRVVARLHDIRNAPKAKKAGADEIVSPDFTGGMRIASAMVRPHVVSFMDQMLRTDDNLRVEEVTVAPAFKPQPLGQAVKRSRHYLVMATRQGEHWRFNPADEDQLTPGTVVVLMTSPQGRVLVEGLLSVTL
jgi:voltage-gated potassium channel